MTKLPSSDGDYIFFDDFCHLSFFLFLFHFILLDSDVFWFHWMSLRFGMFI